MMKAMRSALSRRRGRQRLDIRAPLRMGLLVVLAVPCAALVAVTRAPFETGAALAEVRIVGDKPHDITLPAGFGVARMMVRDGQDVTAGDVIAVLDAAAIDAQTAALKAQAATIERRLDLVRREAQDVGDLMDKSQVSRTKVAALEGELIELERASTEILARIARAEQQLTQQDIRAPVSGRVMLVAAKDSAAAPNVAAGGPVADIKVARIVPPAGRLVVEARLPAREAEAWQLGHEARVWLNGLSWLQGRPARARLTWIAAGPETGDGAAAAHVAARLELDVDGSWLTAAVAELPGLRGGLVLREGQQTLLQQLLEPLRRNLNRSSRA